MAKRQRLAAQTLKQDVSDILGLLKGQLTGPMV